MFFRAMKCTETWSYSWEHSGCCLCWMCVT